MANVVNRLSMKGAGGNLPGYPCIRTCLPGGSEADLFPGASKVLHPIHGEYRHRMAQRELAQFMGVQRTMLSWSTPATWWPWTRDSCEVMDHVTCGGIFVDGLGVGRCGNIVLQDRQNLAQNGIIVVVLTLEKHGNQLLAGPDIVSRGFVYVQESEDLLEEAHTVVYRRGAGLPGPPCQRLG